MGLAEEPVEGRGDAPWPCPGLAPQGGLRPQSHCRGRFQALPRLAADSAFFVWMQPVGFAVGQRGRGVLAGDLAAIVSVTPES